MAKSAGATGKGASQIKGSGVKKPKPLDRQSVHSTFPTNPQVGWAHAPKR
jgi:hypothetical protein